MKRINLAAAIVAIISLSIVPLVNSVHSETSWEPVDETVSISTAAVGMCDTTCKNLYQPHWFCIQYNEPIGLTCVDRGTYCTTETCNFCEYPCS